MLLKTLEKKSNKYLKAELHYREIKKHIMENNKNGIIVNLKKLGNKIGLRSKNSVKKYIKIFNQGNENFMLHYLKNKSSSYSYPLILKKLIGHRFKNFRQEFYNKFKKNGITFLTFIDECSQIYFIDEIDYSPSSSYIHQTLLDLGYCSTLSRHSTKRNARWRLKKMNEIDEKEKLIIEKAIGEILFEKIEKDIEKISNESFSNQRALDVGQNYEQDGWEFLMQDGAKANLTLCIEGATGFMLSGHITETETNIGHLLTISKALQGHGKPLNWVFDKRAGIYGESKAQIRDNLEKLEINVVTSSDPNAKPRVERTNRTLENDFIYIWMRKEKIKTIADFNLKMDLFVKAYNTKYQKTLTEENMIVPITNYELKGLGIEYKIKILPDQTMYFQGKRYGFLNKSGKRNYASPGRNKILINHDGVITLKNNKLNLLCSTNYKGKKVFLPNLKSINEIVNNFKKEGTNITTGELSKIHLLLDNKISEIKAYKS